MIILMIVFGACADEVAMHTADDPTAADPPQQDADPSDQDETTTTSEARDEQARTEPPTSVPSTPPALCEGADCPVSSDPTSFDDDAKVGDGHRKGRPLVKDVVPYGTNPHLRPFEAFYAKSTDTHALVAYWGGVDGCDVPTAVEVEESARWIRIRLTTGSDPTVDGPCPELAEWQAAMVSLSQPVGNRIVVDANDGDRHVPVEDLPQD